jgi:hypothetical protein
MKKIFTVFLFSLLCNFLTAQHLKKDGTPDMRFKENKQTNYSTTTVTSVLKYNSDATYNYTIKRDSKGRIKRSQAAKTNSKNNLVIQKANTNM